MIRMCTLTCMEDVKKMLFVCKPLDILSHKIFLNDMESFYEANMNKRRAFHYHGQVLNIIDP